MSFCSKVPSIYPDDAAKPHCRGPILCRSRAFSYNQRSLFRADYATILKVQKRSFYV
jgi:hypothetical protein